MSGISTAARELCGSMRAYKPTDVPGEQINKLFDTILAEAKREKPDSVVLAALEPLQRSVSGSPMTQAADIQAMLDQIVSLYSSGGASFSTGKNFDTV